MITDLDAVAEYSRQIAIERTALAAELIVLASLEMKNGQDFSANLTVCGKKFSLVTMGSNYLPERIQSLDVIRLELIKYQQGIVSSHRSGLEGLEWRLRQAAGGAA